MMSLVRAQLGEPKKTSNLLVARFFRLFVLSTMGSKASVKKTVRWTVFSEGISSDTLIHMCNFQAWWVVFSTQKQVGGDNNNQMYQIDFVMY